MLIPLGRSLQRHAAENGDYFRYPRVVIAVTGEAADSTTPYLKDRLYLGFHEKAETLEVISYNPAAGRFEFQVADDYRAGGTARLRYANRALCLACHQNAAPIFSRQSWDESSANPRIATSLGAAAPGFYALAWRAGVDIPNAIDDATDRANLLPLAAELCARPAARAPPAGRVAGNCCAWRCASGWPAGWRPRWHCLRSRQPPQAAAGAVAQPLARRHRGRQSRPAEPPALCRPGARCAHAGRRRARAGGRHQRRLRPLALRPPLETWPLSADTVSRLVAVLASFFSDADAARATRLASAAASETTIRLDCLPRQREGRIDLDCRGEGITLAGRVTTRGDSLPAARSIAWASPTAPGCMA